MKAKVSSMNAKDASQSGFTLLETVVAMLVLTIGLVALAGTISYALAARNMSRNVTDAKLQVVTMLEQIENLRNTKHLTFAQIANTTEVDDTGAFRTFTGFPTGFRTISIEPGADGIYGTTDDPAATNRAGYTRKVIITPLPVGATMASCNLKKIEVTVSYPGQSGTTQQLVGVGYINNEARGNYIR